MQHSKAPGEDADNPLGTSFLSPQGLPSTSLLGHLAVLHPALSGPSPVPRSTGGLRPRDPLHRALRRDGRGPRPRHRYAAPRSGLTPTRGDDPAHASWPGGGREPRPRRRGAVPASGVGRVPGTAPRRRERGPHPPPAPLRGAGTPSPHPPGEIDDNPPGTSFLSPQGLSSTSPPGHWGGRGVPLMPRGSALPAPPAPLLGWGPRPPGAPESAPFGPSWASPAQTNGELLRTKSPIPSRNSESSRDIRRMFDLLPNAYLEKSSQKGEKNT